MSTDVPERFELTSQSPTEHGLNALRRAFPEVLRGEHIDFDALRRSLGEWIEPVSERFGLSWPGKAECMRVIQEPSNGTLVPLPDESADWDSTQNAIIEGDNLEVLKLLQKAYYGKVKQIYIDPPYNTGGEFIYPDNFREGLADYLRYSGQVDEEGLKVSANAETDGRYHSKWLSMMYPRLFLARNLLREDGLLFVSIDDNEAAQLRLMLNEIFGEENFVAQLVWQRKTGAGARSRGYIVLHEYVFVYAKSRSDAWDLTAPMSEKTKAMYSKVDEHVGTLGPYATWPLDTTSMDERTNLRFPILHDGAEIWPRKQWLWSRERVEQAQRENKLVFNRNDKTGSWSVRFKGYLNDADGTERDGKPTTLILGTYTQEGTKDFSNWFERDTFPFPKPVALIKTLLGARVTVDRQSDEPELILDFFAGSGTTGEAVLQMNAEDGGNRRFILVQLPEPIEDDELRSIAGICRERVRRSGAALKQKESETLPLHGRTLDSGFRSYSLAASNFQVWDGTTQSADSIERQLAMSVDHVTDVATELSMLAELLLKAGFPLSASIEAVDLAGVSGYAVAGGALLICLSQGLTIEAFEAMVESEPAMILVLDAGFNGNDELKVNALQTVRARNQSSGSDIALRVV